MAELLALKILFLLVQTRTNFLSHGCLELIENSNLFIGSFWSVFIWLHFICGKVARVVAYMPSSLFYRSVFLVAVSVGLEIMNPQASSDFLKCEKYSDLLNWLATYYLFHFRDKETEGQVDEVDCPKPYSDRQ